MATTKEINAAFDVIHAHILRLINTKMSSGMASMFRGHALEALDGPDGRRELVAGIKEGLEAAEKARA